MCKILAFWCCYSFTLLFTKTRKTRFSSHFSKKVLFLLTLFHPWTPLDIGEKESSEKALFSKNNWKIEFLAFLSKLDKTWVTHVTSLFFREKTTHFESNVPQVPCEKMTKKNIFLENRPIFRKKRRKPRKNMENLSKV